MTMLSDEEKAELYSKEYENCNFTVENFINRLSELPRDMKIIGYKFIADDGEERLIFECGVEV